MSIDLISPLPATDDDFRVIAGVLSRLLREDCLALLHPPSNRIVPCLPLDAIVAKLQSNSPMEAVFGTSEIVPVIDVDSDDPRMVAAVAEARRQFPVFERAFREQDGTDFSVKTLVRDANGDGECIWVAVDRIVDGRIHGRLGNDPVKLKSLFLEAPVCVEAAEIEDWLFVRDEKPQGLFTVSVIEAIAEERRS